MKKDAVVIQDAAREFFDQHLDEMDAKGNIKAANGSVNEDRNNQNPDSQKTPHETSQNDQVQGI